jgi:hypothetical protein
MKRITLILLLAFMAKFAAVAQDRIITITGARIDCKIERTDSTNVYFTTKRNGNIISTHINKAEVSTIVYGSSRDFDAESEPVSLGFGLGMDFGGIGGNLLGYPHKNIGLFGGVGYAFAGMGFNAGTKIRFSPPSARTNPYAIFMYGYNAAVAVMDASQHNKMFYGPTMGFGLDFVNPSNTGYWTAALMIPFRSAEVSRYMDNLQKYHGIEFQNRLLPIAFSVGYRFKLE